MFPIYISLVAAQRFLPLPFRINNFPFSVVQERIIACLLGCWRYFRYRFIFFILFIFECILCWPRKYYDLLFDVLAVFFFAFRSIKILLCIIGIKVFRSMHCVKIWTFSVHSFSGNIIHSVSFCLMCENCVFIVKYCEV